MLTTLITFQLTVSSTINIWPRVSIIHYKTYLLIVLVTSGIVDTTTQCCKQAALSGHGLDKQQQQHTMLLVHVHYSSEGSPPQMSFINTRYSFVPQSYVFLGKLNIDMPTVF